jgi:MFS transporter, DHA1 family, inner membrane transport protein
MSQDGAAAIGSNDRTHRIPRAAYLLTCCIGVIGANSLVLGPIAPEVSQSLGAGVPKVMLAAAGYGLGAAVSALFLTHYIDRLGAFRTLKLAMSVLPFALIVCAIAPDVTVLIGAQFLAGLSAGVALPAIYANASTIAPPGLERKTVSIVLTGWMLSLVAGVSLSAVLADLVQWRAVYAVVALLTVLAVMSLPRIEQRNGASATPAAMPLSALVLPGIKPILLANAAFLTPFYGIYAYLGAHLHQGLKEPVRVNGLIALAYGAGFGCAVFVGRLIERVGIRRALSMVLLSIALTYLLVGLASGSITVIVVLFAILGLMNHLGINLLILRLTAINPSKRGSTLGLNSAVTNLSAFAGTSLFGLIYSHAGFAVSAYVGMAFLLLAAAISLFASRSH